MNKLFFGLFMAAFALNAHAQTEGFIFEGDLSIKTTGAFLKLQGENITDVKNFLEQKGVKGSPYLMDEFVDGFVVTNTNIKYINVPLQFIQRRDRISQRRICFGIAKPERLSCGIHRKSIIYLFELSKFNHYSIGLF